MNYLKVLGYGLLNYLVRFALGGILYMGVKMDPLGLLYGSLLTITALITAYLLLRYVMKPATVGEAVTIAIIWIIMALVLDIITAQPIVKVDIGFMLQEWQTWTRLAVILLVAPFTVKK